MESKYTLEVEQHHSIFLEQYYLEVDLILALGREERSQKSRSRSWQKKGYM
jgi:hypothetical protein